MRNVLCLAFLVGVASTSLALASPIAANSSDRADAVSRPEVVSSRSESGETSPQPSLRAQSENKADRRERQVLSKNFHQPRPVQIYWFFGGR